MEKEGRGEMKKILGMLINELTRHKKTPPKWKGFFVLLLGSFTTVPKIFLHFQP
jgi:hypothetical protein